MKRIWHIICWLLKWLLLLPILFYQKCISPLTPPACRFTPTCSEYARQAIGLGVREYLLKPITAAELRQVLDRVRE